MPCSVTPAMSESRRADVNQTQREINHSHHIQYIQLNNLAQSDVSFLMCLGIYFNLFLFTYLSYIESVITPSITPLRWYRLDRDMMI